VEVEGEGGVGGATVRDSFGVLSLGFGGVR
jgi:hypothetical protein